MSSLERRGRRTNCWIEVVEGLEPRRLFAATIATPIADTIVAVNNEITTEVDLGDVFSDPNNVLVDLSTNKGVIQLLLRAQDAPQTVANFLNYVNSGAYNGTIIHRSVSGVLIQGGGFTTTGQAIPAGAPVVNEFDPSRPNLLSTIAMAKTGGPDSATDQWYINLADNPSFDNPSNMGGFTVFGTVSPDSFPVAQAIGALATADGTALNPQFDHTLPVLNASAPVTDPTNLVVVQEAQTVSLNSAFHYSAVSDNPSLVAPTVEGNTLILDYPTAGATGVAHITVTGDESNGTSANTTFTASVTAPPIPFGAGTAAAKGLIFIDANGNRQTLSLSGPGTASVTFAGANLTQTPNPKAKTITVSGSTGGTPIFNLSTTGTTARSTLKIAPGRGTSRGAVLDLPNLTTDAPIGSISAPNARLTGALTAGGAIGKLTLASVSGGSLTLNGAVGSARGGAAITVGSLSNATLTASVAVQSITVRGGVDASTLTFTAPGVVDLGKLAVSGPLANSQVIATGSLGSVSAASTTASKVYAGIDPAVATGTSLPTSAVNFVSPSRIDSVTFRNLVGTNLAATTLGKLNLGTVSTANGGTRFVVAGRSITSLSAKLSSGGRINVKRATNASVLAGQLLKDKVNLAGTDFAIALV